MNAENAGICNTLDIKQDQVYCVPQVNGKSMLTGDGGVKENWFDDSNFTCTELEVFLVHKKS